MRYRNACLRLFVVLLQDFNIVNRDFITTLIIVVLNYTIIQYFTFNRAFISWIVWPPLLYMALGYFCLFYKKYIVFNMTMHSTHSVTISLYQTSCLNVLSLVSYASSSGRNSVGR